MNSSAAGSASALETRRRVTATAFAAVAVTLMVSVTLNVLLAHKVRSLNTVQSTRMAERLLKVGAAVPPITAKRVDGQQEIISYEGTNQPTILYIFTPPCVWCARNLDNFKTLLDRERGEHRFIALSLSDEGLAQYIAKNDLKLPVYSELSPETLKTYKLGSTPQTIVISPEGKVLEDWAGAYVGDQKSQVEAFFHVSLPGLRDLPKAEAAKEKGQTAPQAN
jgi:peroxiredoxin